MAFLVKGIWEKGTFTVPEDVSGERVKFKFDEYRRAFGNILEAQGYTVIEMTKPTLSTSVLKTEPGEKRYDFWARVIRKPSIIRLSIPDYAVPHYQKRGLKLLD